jgi:CubicO group peptidase (beta-lactamase class C family)
MGSCSVLALLSFVPAVADGAELVGGSPSPPPVHDPMPWPKVSPAAVGLDQQLLDKSRDFINSRVKQRQCFLVIKDGKIAYEWYNPNAAPVPLAPVWHGSPQDKPHNGYSMTKTAGGFLLLLAATEGGLDLDVDITQKYGIPSPKPYRVTVRQMMAQIIGGEDRPGEKWRYDEMGNMYLHLFPQIIQKATGKPAMYWLTRLSQLIGLTSSFAWPNVNTMWFRGAHGSCRDWARFGQLILNRGTWNGKQVIASQYIDQMQEPVKMPADKEYSNPCYGLLIWLNADKSKHPGCCWEASRLPEPKCGGTSFMDGAVTDMTLNIGLYGQVVMTLPSVNTVVVGFGNDLRPIEPARIGYYPGVCKALGIRCNTPPAVPQTKCGEHLECTGVSAQCFSGGAWSHAEPTPGGMQCVSCFQNRLPYHDRLFPEAHYMVKDWCPGQQSIAFDYIKCFCGLTGKNANPFHPWQFHPPALGMNQSHSANATTYQDLLMV